jgi:hypothetical protein
LYRRRVPAPALRPLGIGETLDVAIKIYMRNAVTLFKLVLVVVAPINLVSTIVQASARPSGGLTFDQTGGQVNLHDLWTLAAGTLVALVLVLLATTLASAACFKAVADAYLGEEVAWRRSLGYAAGRFRSIVWVTFLSWIVAVLGLILCVIPGIYLWVSFTVAIPVLLTEQLRGRKALRRSRLLVKGRWWPVLAVVFLGSLLTSIVSGALSAIASGVVVSGSDVNTVPGFLASFLSDTVANTLTLPFTAAFVTVIYFDLRVRKEAFDLQLLAQQIGVDVPEGEMAPIAPLQPLPQPAPGAVPPYWPPPPGWTPAAPDEPPSA